MQLLAVVVVLLLFTLVALLMTRRVIYDDKDDLVKESVSVCSLPLPNTFEAAESFVDAMADKIGTGATLNEGYNLLKSVSTKELAVELSRKQYRNLCIPGVKYVREYTREQLTRLLSGLSVGHRDRLYPSCRVIIPYPRVPPPGSSVPPVLKEDARDIKAFLIDSVSTMFVDATDTSVRPFLLHSPPLSRCAVVGNSGILLKSGSGANIDSHTHIFRMNAAPTKGFDIDTGNRTTFRILRNDIVFYENCDEILVGRFGGERNRKARALFQIAFPAELLLLLNESFFEKYANRLIEPIWGNRLSDPQRSVGIIATLMAVGLCDQVTLFGFNSVNASLSRHYWGPYKGKPGHAPSMEACLLEHFRQLGLVSIVDWSFDPMYCKIAKAATGSAD